jgi:hypothetical protein
VAGFNHGIWFSHKISLLPELRDSTGVYGLAARVQSGVQKDKK